MTVQKLPDEERFIIAVLWMCGWPVAAIAARCGATPGKVRGVVHRLPYPPRSELSVADRQKILDELKAGRRDGGRLPDTMFVAEFLEAGQVKTVRRIDFSGGERRSYQVDYGDRETVRLPRDVQPKGLGSLPVETDHIAAGRRRDGPVAKAEPGRGGRRRILEDASEKGSPILQLRDHSAAPLEYLEFKHVLQDRPKKDMTREQVVWMDGAEHRRLVAARRLRDVFEGAEISPARSLDLMKAPGGAGRPSSIADYVLDCQKEVARLREGLPEGLLAILEAVVHRDLWIWQDVRRRSEKRRIFDDIRRGLDFVSFVHGEVSLGELSWRWPEPYSQELYRRLRPFIHRTGGKG
ncbi:hypothetical protein [Rhodobium gokarnense]|uniref:Uncharacterized protein n=1 Tax=Rhodobium gokarnense TaxID=364296 RepID=A0ABT3HH85_9HYPH|nr:hypothetical protein [Rhodobium gokarnense]MCW2309704.1 hypothetical protein [Rhodobium gokarnense]